MCKKVMSIVAIVLLTIVLGQIARMKFSNIGLVNIHEMKDLSTISFSFDSVEGKSEAEYYIGTNATEYIEDCVHSENIFIAVPTGKVQIGKGDSLQEVVVNKVISGEKSMINEKVWVDCLPGVEYDGINILLDAPAGWMLEGKQYLICSSSYGSQKNASGASKYYAVINSFGYLNLETTDPGMLIDDKKKYTYDEISQSQFYAADEEILKLKQKIKEKIVKKLVKE